MTARTPPDLSDAVQIVCSCGRTHVVATSPPKRNDDDELCDARNNPLGSQWSFRRLIKAGAFPAYRGPRGKLIAKRADVLAYLESRQVTPVEPPADELDLDDDDAVFRASGLKPTRG